jgi:hypothetical protein
MSRLYTFGCSFTGYRYPTWADFVGQGFDVYENWAKSGAGNFYIASQLHECNQINELNEDDHVLIMLSSFSRYDFIDNMSVFHTPGNIYSQDYLDEKFKTKYWSDEYGFYMSWFCVNSIINLLEFTGCKYKLMCAFDLLKVENKSYIFEDSSKPRVSRCSDYFEKVLPKVNMKEWFDNSGDGYYNFKNHIPDYHPKITSHHNWVKEFLPEYYKPEMKELSEEWEKLIAPTYHETIENFGKILDRKHIINFSKHVTI